MERRQIEIEELARAQAEQERRTQAQREQAALKYRQEIRRALQPRPGWWPLHWFFPVLPLLAGVAYYFVTPELPPVTDNTWGGIGDSALMERCRGEISRQTYPQEPDLRFPSPQEAQGQVSARPDGKRWDGWAARPDGTRLEFACSFTSADDSVKAELIQDEPGNE